MRFKTHVRMESARLDMISLINCLFLLIIFFLLSSTVIVQPGIRVDLPVVSNLVPVREANEVFVTLTRDGKIYLAEKPCTWAGLKPRLRSLHKSDPSRLIVIKADNNVPHSHTTRLLSYAQAAGFSRIALAASKPVKGAGPKRIP